MKKVITLGEILLRLSTINNERLAHCAQLALNLGGCEANVAISLANFGHEVIFASKVPNHALGLAAINQLKQYGVDTQYINKGGNRLGTYYLEQGVGVRSAKVIYDRANSSFAEIKKNEWSSDLFTDANLFHVSGITCALSDDWSALIVELIKSAKQAGCKISFDINYRAKLWSYDQARKVLREILPLVDYCSAGILDAKYLLELPVKEHTTTHECYQLIHQKFPNIQCLYSTNRKVHSASVNELQGMIWLNGEYFESRNYSIDNIVDRVGGGDAFAAGILHGLLENYDLQTVIEFATAASVLKHSISGDCNQFLESEVLEYIQSDSSRIVR